MAYVMNPPKVTPNKNDLRPPPALHGSPPRKKERTTPPVQNDQVFIGNISFCIPASHFHENELRDKCATIFARLQQIDPSLVVLPSNPNPDTSSDLPPLTSGSSFPTDPETFSLCFSPPNLTHNFGTVHASLQSSTCFNNIKCTQFVVSFLQKHRFFLQQHSMKSVNVSSVAWFFKLHPELHSPSSIESLLEPLLPSELLDKIQFKLHMISHQLDMKVSARTWVIEMDKEEAQQHTQTLLENLTMMHL